jgi:CHAT domain-containing protein
MPVETVRRAVDEMSAASRPDAASLLGRVIIAPDVIGAAVDTLVIVPDAVFATVPFEALTDPRTGKPLIERYVVAECHSVASYLRATASSSTSPAALLVDGSQPDDMPRLPEAAAEIHQLRQFYPSTTEWRSDRQSIASLRVALEKAGLIHFAAHAIVNHTNELLSNIVLGNKSEILYAHEIAALQLAGHPIVILSTCSGAATAGSRRRRAPTLADAFLAAGASAVVAASDRIDDARARRFSLLLHERLRHGMPVGRAVREIQLAFAREGQPWSDLVVIGNPAAILRLGPS